MHFLNLSLEWISNEHARMTPELTVKTREIDVKDAQLNSETGNAPFVERTIFADERESLTIRGRRAAKNAQEIVNSQGFEDLLDRYQRFFDHPTKDLQKMLERRKMELSQGITNPIKFKSVLRQIAGHDGSSQLQISKEDFEKHLPCIKGVINYWLGLRSSFQLNARRKSNDEPVRTTAQEEERHFLEAIQDLFKKINIVGRELGSEEELNIEEGTYPGAVHTVVGGTRDSIKKVFRVVSGEKGVSYGKGLNVETVTKRRTSGAPIDLEEDRYNTHMSIENRPAHETEILEGGEWIMRTYNVGGLPIEVCFNSQYGSHLLPGLEALFGETDDSKISGDAPVKLYFGVDPKLMTGRKQRIVYSRHRELRMMISAEKEMDYFGYLKKSLLTMKNLWISMLSSVMSRKYHLDEHAKNRNQEMMRDFPEELRELSIDLAKFQGKQPIRFEQTLLPQIEIPEIEYETKESGFNPGRYILMPVHGASYTIEMGDGKEMNFVLPGDSGVGKSEVLRELRSKGIKVTNIQADDMLYMVYDRETGQTYSVGTENGAFTKTDDLPQNGTVNTSDKRPLIGYNAEEKGGNRRVIEPLIAEPLVPKKVDGLLALVNAFKPEDEDQRVKQVSIQELVETWIEGPYKKSSSITGGGISGNIINVPFWNEFGPDKVTNLLRYLIHEIFINAPDDSEGITRSEKRIMQERGKIKAFIVNTFCESSGGDDLNKIFGMVATQLKDALEGKAI